MFRMGSFTNRIGMPNWKIALLHDSMRIWNVCNVELRRTLLVFISSSSIRSSFFAPFFFVSENAFFHSCVLSRVFVEYRQFWNATPMQNNPKKNKPHSLSLPLSLGVFAYGNISLLLIFLLFHISSGYGSEIRFHFHRSKKKREKIHTNLVSFPLIVKHFRHSSNRIFVVCSFCWLFFDRQMNQINKYLLPLPLRKINTVKKNTPRNETNTKLFSSYFFSFLFGRVSIRYYILEGICLTRIKTAKH